MFLYLRIWGTGDVDMSETGVERRILGGVSKLGGGE